MSSFMLENYIVCNICGLRSPLFVSIIVLHITPPYTSPTQEFIIQGTQQKHLACRIELYFTAYKVFDYCC